MCSSHSNELMLHFNDCFSTKYDEEENKTIEKVQIQT